MTARDQADTVQLKVRLKEPDRAILEKSAQARGVSLNTEIVDRLRRSFVDDQSAEEIFGGRRNYDLMKLIASIAGNVTNIRKPGADWLTDPYVFDQVTTAITAVLNTIRPDAPLPTTEEATASGGIAQGRIEAHVALKRVIQDDVSSLYDLIKETRLPGKIVSKISAKYLPYVEMAQAEGISVAEAYKRAQPTARSKAKVKP